MPSHAVRRGVICTARSPVVLIGPLRDRAESGNIRILPTTNVRRAYVEELRTGPLQLPPATAHHLCRVLRLTTGATVELFDAVGRSAVGVLRVEPSGGVFVDVEAVRSQDVADERPVSIASAVPKGERADWLVEKLAELGVARWCPLITARSVVRPEGSAKLARWRRIAQEAARQSGSPHVLSIDDPAPLDNALSRIFPMAAVVGSTARTALRIDAMLHPASRASPPAWGLIGPEGGWTDDELRRLESAGVRAVSLGRTILRVETAAVVLAVALRWASFPESAPGG